MVGPPIDIALSGELDLLLPRVLAWLSFLLTSGSLGSIMVEPVCTTFSIMRRPPLRGKSDPLGFEPRRHQTHVGNVLALRALTLLTLAWRLYIPGLCEQPWTSMMRYLRQWKALERKERVSTARTASEELPVPGCQHEH